MKGSLGLIGKSLPSPFLLPRELEGSIFLHRARGPWLGYEVRQLRMRKDAIVWGSVFRIRSSQVPHKAHAQLTPRTVTRCLKELLIFV